MEKSAWKIIEQNEMPGCCFANYLIAQEGG